MTFRFGSSSILRGFARPFLGSSVIHMNVEDVEQAIFEFRHMVHQWRLAYERIQMSKHRLGRAWQGPQADQFLDEMNALQRRWDTLGKELERLLQLLQAEKDEWVAMASSFGIDKEGYATGFLKLKNILSPPTVPEWSEGICRGRQDFQTCMEIWSAPPQNAGDLAYMIATLPEDHPIGIFDLGNGEILVLVKGTDPDSPERGNNLGGAVESEITHNNSEQLSVLEALYEAQKSGLIPSGAKLHIAGHSQGGMVAQNLAVDPRVKRMGLEVSTVITFGSPDTFLGANPDTKYIMFAHENDWIPRIDEGLEGIGEAFVKPDSIGGTILKNILHHRLNDVENIAERHIIHAPTTGRGLFEAHDYARQSAWDELSHYDVSLGGQGEWGHFDLYQSTIQTPVAELWNILFGEKR